MLILTYVDDLLFFGKDGSTSSAQPHIEAFAEIRLNIIDEISFAEYNHVLRKISNNLQNVMPCHDHQYGNIIDLVGSGDFCQLVVLDAMLTDGLPLQKELALAKWPTKPDVKYPNICWCPNVAAHAVAAFF